MEAWPFVIALAAVINGLGVVRLIGGLGEYIKKQSTHNIQHYWVFTILVVFQLFAHLLLWWSILGLSVAGNINFLTYLYLLIGPTLLYLCTSLIIPEIKDKAVDLYSEYYNFRKIFYSMFIIFWLWAIFVWPVFGHPFAPTVPLITVWLVISVILRLTDNSKIHAALVISNCIVYVMFVAIYAMQLGEVARRIVG